MNFKPPPAALSYLVQSDDQKVAVLGWLQSLLKKVIGIADDPDGCPVDVAKPRRIISVAKTPHRDMEAHWCELVQELIDAKGDVAPGSTLQKECKGCKRQGHFKRTENPKSKSTRLEKTHTRMN